MWRVKLFPVGVGQLGYVNSWGVWGSGGVWSTWVCEVVRVSVTFHHRAVTDELSSPL